MRQLLVKSLAGSGLLLMTLTASGQWYPRPDYRYTISQDGREAREQSRVFDRAQGDLDQAHSVSLPFTDDRNRIIAAQAQVGECQRLVASGEYSRRQLDEAIIAVQRVADMNRMSDRNRDSLRDDVRDMQQLQSLLEG